MKVVQIGGTYGGGGPGTTTEYVHKGLINKGHESHVYQVESSCDEKNVYKALTPLSLFIYRVLIKFRLNISFFASIRTAKLIKFLKNEKPDVVHLRVLHNGWWNEKMLLSYLFENDVPVVLSLHDMWYITGGCYHFLDNNCTQYKTGCRKCLKRRTQIDCFPFETHKKWNEKRRLLQSSKNLEIIAVSEWVENMLSGSIIENRHCNVIHNGVDTGIFKPFDGASRSSNKKFIIGVANNWNHAKGIDDFIKLAKLISNDYRIRLVGNVSAAIREEAEAVGIEFVGKIKDRNKLAQIYSSSNVFVTFSHQETFGLVAAEAACCGLKTVGFDISAIPEVIRKCKGTVVPFRDVESAWKAIRDICENGKVLKGEELNEVRKSLSIEKMVSEHIELYEKMYKRNNG
jgi:putative colanic acid biosynthesis glycosyltransferase